MICSRCHTLNFQSYRFCRECGTRLAVPSVADPSVSTDDAREDRRVEQLLEQAFTLLEQGQYDEALATVQAALAAQPGSAAAHSVLSMVYERQGKVEEAVHQLDLVLQLNPDSAADRERLELLTLGPRPVVAGPRVSPVTLALASAGVAGAVVFGAGLALALRSRPAPGPRLAQSRPARPLPLPTSPAPSMPAQPPAAAGFTPIPLTLPPMRPSTTPFVPTVPTPLRTPAPAAGPTPAPAAKPAAKGSMGLQPAAVRQVAPILPPANGDATAAPAPGTAAAAPAPAPGPAVAPNPPATLVVPPLGAALPAPAPAPAPAPRRPAAELPEPETGFIRIEPVNGRSGAANGGGRAPVREARNPSISVSIDAAPAPADYSALDEARRAERLGYDALRRGNVGEAERQYGHAARLYEAVSRRGGGEGKQAQEGLETCRRVLGTLR